MKLGERQADLDGPKHFLLHPCGYGAFVALPFNDCLSCAAAKLLSELFTGEAAGVSEFSKLLAGHGRWKKNRRNLPAVQLFYLTFIRWVCLMRLNCPLYMTATLQLNLSDALSVEELRELTRVALEEKKPLERVLLEAARELRAQRKKKSCQGSRTKRAA